MTKISKNYQPVIEKSLYIASWQYTITSMPPVKQYNSL